MNRQMIVLIVLVAAVSIVPASADTLEIRGEVAELKTTQSTAIMWNAYNFDVFWCDLDDDLMTETLTIAAGTLTGPNTDRTIDKNCLSYQTSPAYQQYEFYENEGLTVNGDTGYYLEGFMGGRYVAINGRADKLCKHLVEFEDDDKKTLATGEAWDLGGGFALTAGNLSCPCEAPTLCDSCTLLLSKNGVKLDEQTIYVNTSDEQDRVYTYAPDIGGEEHVPVFSCYVDAVYNGTESDIVQLKYVFLIDDDVLEIGTGDTYGVMEVVTASSSYILLRNMDAIDLDTGSIEPIMDNIRFMTADDDSAIRLYPMVEYNEPGMYKIRGNVVHLDGAQSVDLVWDAANFAGFWYDMDNGLKTEQLKLLAGTINSATGDRTINKNTLIYTTSPVYQHYKLYTNEGLTVDSDHPGGDTGYWIEGWMGGRYVAIDSKADKRTTLLVEFDRYDIKTLNSGDTWDLGDGFVLELVGINDAGNIATLQLFKNAVPLKGSLKCIDTSTGIKQDRVYTYLKDVAGEDNIPIFSCYVAAVFKEGSTSHVQLKYVFLIDDDVIEIETGDIYGIMEATASSSEVILRNEDFIDLDWDCTEHIMGDLYFRIADDETAIRFYPFTERTTPHIPETLTVDDSGGADYLSIQAAIYAAESGDTIMVYNGTYHENVKVNKQLTLIGIGMPVVDGGWDDSAIGAIEVTADHCTIDGFRVMHGYLYGIFLCYSSNNMLSNNTASNNFANGIHLFSSSNNMLSSNTASNNPCSGIQLYESSNNNTLENNTANSNNWHGISLYSSSNNNTIYHNTLIDNTQNTYDTGTNQWDSGTEGNYYSDYTGTDTNRDGIGDDSYDIPGGTSIDRFPLMQPWAATTPQKGDLNGDNQITPADAAIALRLAATGAQNPAADVSDDGVVTSLDALMIH